LTFDREALPRVLRRTTTAFLLPLHLADADNFETPAADPAPRLRLLRDHDHASFIDLPAAQPK
jgi:hypothetical protein